MVVGASRCAPESPSLGVHANGVNHMLTLSWPPKQNQRKHTSRQFVMGNPVMRLSRLLPLVAAVLVSQHASAYTIEVLSPGTLFPPVQYGPVATFDSIPQTAYGDTTATGLFSDGGANFSGSGIVMNNGGQGSAGLYATPFGDATNYLAVLGGGSETIAFSATEIRLRALLGLGRHLQLPAILRRRDPRGDRHGRGCRSAAAGERRPDGLRLKRLRPDRAFRSSTGSW